MKSVEPRKPASARRSAAETGSKESDSTNRTLSAAPFRRAFPRAAATPRGSSSSPRTSSTPASRAAAMASNPEPLPQSSPRP